MKNTKPFLLSCCAFALAFAAHSSVAATFDVTFSGNITKTGEILNLDLYGFVLQGQTVPNAVLVSGDTLDVSFELTQPFTLPAGATPQLKVELPANFLGTNGTNQVDYSETIAFSKGGVAVPNSIFTPFSSASASANLELGGFSTLALSPALSFDRLDLAVTLLDGKVATVPNGGQPQLNFSITAPSVVPTPASLYLLVSGLTGLAALAFVGHNRNKQTLALTPAFG